MLTMTCEKWMLALLLLLESVFNFHTNVFISVWDWISDGKESHRCELCTDRDDWPNVVLHLWIWQFCLVLLLVIVLELSVFLKISDITCGAVSFKHLKTTFRKENFIKLEKVKNCIFQWFYSGAIFVVSGLKCSKLVCKVRVEVW